MNKKILLILPVLPLLFSCTTNGTTSNENNSNDVHSPYEYKYGQEEVYQNIWEDEIIYNESVVLVESMDGVISSNLLYEPTEIISIRQQDLKREISIDNFSFEGRKIILKDGVKGVPYIDSSLDHGDYLPDGIKRSNAKDGGSIIATTTDSGILVIKQIAVTYAHKDKWNGPQIKKQGDKLPKIHRLLDKKKDVNVIVYGDSIFYGCNSTAYLGMGPNLPTLANGIKKEINRRYESEVYLTNTSQGSTTSKWGLENVKTGCPAEYSPDLLFIGFGMNDGSAKVSTEDYVNNIKGIIDATKKENPDISIVVASTILPNINSAAFNNQELYQNPLQEMIDGYEDVAMVNYTSFSRTLWNYKNSYELLANNINHPTDFVIRSMVSLFMNCIAK